MQFIEPLLSGNFYHIYNRGVAHCDLFYENNNYEHFLGLYDRYISPVADTYAWVLMKNHFHVLVRIKENIAYKYSNTDRSIDAVRFDEIKWQTTNLSACEAPDSVKIPKPHLHFSHLFNAYAKYINKLYDRQGELFSRPFKRKLIDNKPYLKKTILYIHNNPVHHGFCTHPLEYPWSSYLTCITSKPTKLQRKDVIDLFVDSVQFKKMHESKIDFTSFEKWLEL
jgi:putative transposase